MGMSDRALAVQAALALDGTHESLECVTYVVEAMLRRGAIGAGRMLDSMEMLDMSFEMLDGKLVVPSEDSFQRGVIAVTSEVIQRIEIISAAVRSLREPAA